MNSPELSHALHRTGVEIYFYCGVIFKKAMTMIIVIITGDKIIVLALILRIFLQLCAGL